MAGEFPGLPNWGYGVNIGLRDVLALLPRSMERRKGEAEIGETQARAQLLGAQSEKLAKLTPAELQQMIAQTGLLGAQTTRTKELTPVEAEEGRAGAEQKRASAGLLGEQAASEAALRDIRSYEGTAQAVEAMARAGLFEQEPRLRELGLLSGLYTGTFPYPGEGLRERVGTELGSRLGLPAAPTVAPTGPTDADKKAFREALSVRGQQRPPGTVRGAVKKGAETSSVGQLLLAIRQMLSGGKQPVGELPTEVLPQQPSLPMSPADWERLSRDNLPPLGPSRQQQMEQFRRTRKEKKKE